MWPFSSRFRHNFDPCLEDILGPLLDYKVGFVTFVKERLEEIPEIGTNRLEGLEELPLCGLVDLVDRRDKIGLSALKVVDLSLQELQALALGLPLVVGE